MGHYTDIEVWQGGRHVGNVVSYVYYHPGVHAISWNGRVGGSTLPLGDYTIKVVPQDEYSEYAQSAPVTLDKYGCRPAAPWLTIVPDYLNGNFWGTLDGEDG